MGGNYTFLSIVKGICKPLPNKILRSGIFDIFINIVDEALKHEIDDNTN